MNQDAAIKEFQEMMSKKFEDLYKSSELICDHIFQDACNRYKVIINTKGHQLLIYDREGRILIDSDPFYITMNKLYRTMGGSFRELYGGKEYEPIPIKNSNLPKVSIIRTQAGDWEAMYINGESVIQDYYIKRAEFLELVNKHNINHDEILEFKASDEDNQMVEDNGTFPDLSEYLLTDYNKDGSVSGDEVEVEICGFEKDWIGACQNPVIPGQCRCDEHINVKCKQCGNLASSTCEHTMGAFVCGKPTCDSCICSH